MITYKYSKVRFQKSAGIASLQASVGHMTWVLATELRSSAGTVPILTCQVHHNHPQPIPFEGKPNFPGTSA